jgi:hypothetical protein
VKKTGRIFLFTSEIVSKHLHTSRIYDSRKDLDKLNPSSDCTIATIEYEVEEWVINVKRVYTI